MSTNSTEIVDYWDLFCGGGGFTEGALRVANKRGLTLRGGAVNHNHLAIATHSANHPYLKHMCVDVNKVRPQEAVTGNYLRLLVASPECTHHSNARGGKPRSDQSRAQPWIVLDWLEKLYIEDVILENVKEFQSWGPLDKDGKPIQSKKGTLFFSFLNSIEALGYQVDWKILNSADYGATTSRERLFIQARREKPITWPRPTHAKNPAPDDLPLFSTGETLKKWRAAREIIDFSLKSESIFGRKKPLVYNTLARIARGLQKICKINVTADQLQAAVNGELVRVYAEDADPTGFVVALNHGKDDSRAYSLENPLPTITSVDAWGKVDGKFILPHPHSNGSDGRSINEPLYTVTATSSDMSIVEPFLTEHYGTSDVRSVDEPLTTITTSGNHHGLVETEFIISAGGPEGQGRNPHSVEEPLGTVMPQDRKAFLQVYHGASKPGLDRIASLDNPVPTIDTSNRYGVVESFAVSYYGTGHEHSLEEPIGALTTKPRYGLVLVTRKGEFILDIRFRMLAPKELANAMGFGNHYKFVGNRENVVKQIGNAVEVNMAEALIGALL